MTEIAVHPAAAVWPMMSPDELDALAVDIAESGLLHPIVLTPDKQLLDGRNRLAACELARVKPSFTTYDDDPVAYVLSANARRRHMTKGAIAMAAWEATRVQNLNTREVAGLNGTSHGHVGQAAVVAQWTPDLVAEVIAGRTSMAIAYEEARVRKAEADSHDARLGRLPEDLAQFVTDERMSLTEAEAAQRRREKDLADQRDGARSLLSKIRVLADPRESNPKQWASEWAGRLDVTPDDVDAVGRMAALFRELHRAMKARAAA